MNKAHNYYLKACKALGKTPIPILEDRGDKDAVSVDAYARLIICIKYMNMIDDKIWIPIYDEEERHYWPRWVGNESGFGLLHTFYIGWSTFSFVGPRLEYRTYDLLKKGIKILKPYYNDYLDL